VTQTHWICRFHDAFSNLTAAVEAMTGRPHPQVVPGVPPRKVYDDAVSAILHLLDHPPEGADPAPSAAAAPAPEVDERLVPRDVTWRSDPLVRAALDTTFAQRRSLPPLTRARQKILYAFIHTFRGPVRGVLAEEIDGIAPDLVAAAVEAVLAKLAAAPAAPRTAG
jgi:hypothetical protein